MQWKQLASAVTKLEGKKSKVKIGDTREVLAILVKLEKQAVKDGDATPPSKLISSRAAMKGGGR